MNTIKLGQKSLFRIGLGTNRITAQSAELLRYAVDHGINFIDTAHIYTAGVSEQVIGTTLAPYPSNLHIASKGGMSNGSPAVLREELDQTLSSLATDCVSLYQLHRIDPNIPLEESLGALKQFQIEGKIEHIGLSEVSIEQIRRAQSVVEITSVQNHYNIAERKYDDVVDYCTDQNIIFIPYFPLGGHTGDSRITQNLEQLAKKYRATTQQLALAWLLKRSPLMLPIPGTLSFKHLDANIAAATIDLSEEDFATL